MENSKKKPNDDFIKFSVDELRILEKSGFFNTYIKFKCTLEEFKEKYIARADTISELIDGAANIYFSEIFKDKSNIEIKFKEKSARGAQVNSILLNITGVFKVMFQIFYL